jgi:hypothetical protein
MDFIQKKFYYHVIMEIDDDAKKILEQVGIFFNDTTLEVLIERDALLDTKLYQEVKDEIAQLKKRLSSSYMTSLQKEAEQRQKWPLLNLVRQILQVYGYKMEPIRKCDGYTKDGIKKFKRFFIIKKN